MLPDCKVALFSQFGGPWTSVDPYSVPLTNGLSAQNVEYINGQVKTRFGHSIILTPNNTITSFTNWLFNILGTPKNWFFYHAAGIGSRAYDLNDIGAGPTTRIPQVTAYSAIYAVAGSRIYVAFYSSGLAGDGSAYIYSYNGGAEKAFSPPITTNPVLTEPLSGLVTTGLHKIGYLITTLNGFTTRPSPAPGDVFTPVSITSTGGKNINVLVTAPWPASAASIQIIMTTVANPNQYYIVPGATVSVPGGVTFPVNVSVSISDSDLAATGASATPYLTLLTQTVAGVAPINPYFVLNYSSRMGYIGLDAAGFPVIYFSAKNKYQNVYADLSGVYLPGNLPITCAQPLRASIYIFGPHWTYTTSDNGREPVEWSPPQLVDGSIGTLAPYGVFQNAAQGFMWVADVGGLYLFIGGQYQKRPISYWQQPEWDRINWAAPQAVYVYDDAVNKKVHVLAPLDAATSPSHELVWEYADGADPDSVNFSYKRISGYVVGCGGIIQNPTTKRLEVWLGPSTNGSVIRENFGNEANPYRDVAAAIDSFYETSLLPGAENGPASLKKHHGGHLRVSGNGTLNLTAYSIQHVVSVTPPAIIMTDPSGIETLVKFFLQNEQCSMKFGTNALDQYFKLALYRHYYTLGAPQR